MQITDIAIRLMNENRLKAFASVTFDSCFVVRNMKVVQGNKGLFVCMPSRKLPDGTHKDMVHPITQEFRNYLEEYILKAYHEELKKGPGVPVPDNGPISDPDCSSTHD